MIVMILGKDWLVPEIGFHYSWGIMNELISDQLFLALSTVKGYNRQIFDKLHVVRHTEALARARQLGLLRL